MLVDGFGSLNLSQKLLGLSDAERRNCATLQQQQNLDRVGVASLDNICRFSAFGRSYDAISKICADTMNVGSMDPVLVILCFASGFGHVEFQQACR